MEDRGQPAQREEYLLCLVAVAAAAVAVEDGTH